MKNISAFLSCIILTYNVLNAQNSADILRCATADYYIHVTPDGTKKINKPCSICYIEGAYFSFYFPELGIRSFKVAEPTSRRIAKNGAVTISLFNEEDQTMTRGDIMVEIEYGAIKTFFISFTKFGDAYMLKSKGFIGSAAAESSNNLQLKKNIAGINKIKSDTIPNSNYKLNPKLRYCGASTPLNITDFINEILESKYSVNTNRPIGKMRVSFSIDKNGKIIKPHVEGYTLIGASPTSDSIVSKGGFQNTVIEIFKSMPNWEPALDEKENPKNSDSCYITLYLGTTRD